MGQTGSIFIPQSDSKNILFIGCDYGIINLIAIAQKLKNINYNIIFSIYSLFR